MNSEDSILLDCEYFPNIAWGQYFYKTDKVIIEQHEFFVRNSYRNRCVLMGPNGIVQLSVPLEGGRNQKCLMKDIRISYNEKWQHVHWKTIQSNYRRSPYFEYFEADIHAFFQQEYTYLLDLNLASVHLILKIGKLKRKLPLSDSFSPYNLEFDTRTLFSPKNLKEAFSHKPYIQTFEAKQGFVGNLSLLDLALHTGTGMWDYL